MLEDESRSKMLQKQKDPMMSEKKVNTKPIDYAALNQLLKDFKTRFVPHTELSAEQAFWSQNSGNSEEPNLSSSTTIVEVPKELPKVSMVNSSLKKLKFHLSSFDMVVKERTTATAITEGTWGFEHTKACFMDEIIPFVKALKELFNSFDQFLIDELTKVQNIFNQMEQAVEQHCTMNECEHCVTIKTELQRDFINKECYDKLFRKYTTLEKHCISLEVDTQLKQEIFQRNNSFLQQSAPTFDQLFEINDLKAQSQEKDTVIMKLKERIKSLSGKMFTTIGHIWRPTERTFTLVENMCPLTRITTTAIVPLRKPIPIESNTTKPVVTLVYSRKSKEAKKKVPVSNSKINKSLVVQIVLWYLDSRCSKHMTGDRSQLINFVQKFLGTVKFENDHVAKIMGYGDYKIRNVTILKVGISPETSVARSPQQNGVVERRNRTLIEAARTIMPHPSQYFKTPETSTEEMMREWMAMQMEVNKRMKNQEDEIKPIPTMPKPNPINSHSSRVSPFLKDSTVHIPYMDAKTFADDVLLNHVGDEELKRFNGVGTGRMTKKEKNDK
nr:integrase, catalytic region, zinc finger, CCHC-type, peptidase aspartic, catalytic [Tanacetum cinerariifolium]